ncbi:MAG: carboxypeptidase-like regulatory domain-containing protein [Planctomycetaceae bacterium]|jgi:hypothetical protein|nr:carboxypeptidase-like regulatory domain-containing protein [Planctomycetaceae bacterium]
MFSNIVIKNLFTLLLLLTLLVCFSGCSNSSRQVESVTGHVTFNGSPLADAQIVFHPKKTNGFAAVGTTQADGTFTLVTPGTTKAGAVVGDYRVSVTKIVAMDDNGKPLTPETTPEDIRKGTRIPQRVSVLPEKYGQPDQSPLEAVVVRGKNTFQFDLK